MLKRAFKHLTIKMWTLF